MQLSLNRSDYRDKVLACWLGKNIGGTVGMPFEWKRQINHIEFYTQDLHGEPVPNDDLDLQLLWLLALEQKGPNLNTRILADYWCLHVTPHWAEYGTAKANLRAGLLPPMSGTLNNVYRHSCGAYIRSEIWACIAPGLPEVAAVYAYEDGIIDHGNGEGTYGEVFFAALESAAFVLSDLRALVTIGLAYIPADCAVARAVRLVEAAFDRGQPWRDTRDEVLRAYRGEVPVWHQPASPDDVAKGLGDGQLGFDVPANVALTVLALLYGAGDFGKTVCLAVNCGEDTDCTAATAGSIYGIIHGTAAIPQKWITPIGRSIKTVVINVGDLWMIPRTVDDLTDRTVAVMDKVLAHVGGDRIAISGRPTDLSGVSVENLKPSRGFRLLKEGLNGPIFHFDFYTVVLNYGEAPLIRSGVPKEIRVLVRSRHITQANLSLRWYLPSGWRAGPSEQGALFLFPGTEREISITLSADRITETSNRAVLEITIAGLPTVMLVPIMLLNGDHMTALYP